MFLNECKCFQQLLLSFKTASTQHAFTGGFTEVCSWSSSGFTAWTTTLSKVNKVGKQFLSNKKKTAVHKSIFRFFKPPSVWSHQWCFFLLFLLADVFCGISFSGSVPGLWIKLISCKRKSRPCVRDPARKWGSAQGVR